MFDVAYEAEARICAARKEKERLWSVVLGSDLSIPLACFCEMMEMQRYDNCILYWSFMFGTHGGF